MSAHSPYLRAGLLVNLLAAIVLFAAAPARADEWDPAKPVNLPNFKFGTTALLSAYYVTSSGTADGVTRRLYKTMLIDSYFQNHPGTSATVALADVDDFLHRVDQGRENTIYNRTDPGAGLGQFADDIASVAREFLDDPRLKAMALVAGKVAKYAHAAEDAALKDYASENNAYADAESMLTHPGGAYPIQVAQQILDVARAHSDADSQEARAINGGVLQQMGISITDDGAEIVAKVPALQAIAGIEQIIDGQGRIETNLGALEDMTRRELGKIQDEIAGVQGHLDGIEQRIVDLNSGQQELLAYARDTETRRQRSEIEAAKAAAAQQQIAAANAGVFLLSSIIGSVDPRAGREVQAVGNAAVQIATSLNQWANAVAGLGTLETLTSMSTLIATGNVVGAAMSLISAFADTGPTPDEMILNAVADVRRDVETLRTEMHDRFDRVDKGINLIYDRLSAGLSRLDLAAGRIENGVKALNDDLISLRGDVDRIAMNLFQVVTDAAGRSLILEANDALRLRERTGGTVTMHPREFFAHENAFWTWGVSFASDAAAAGPPAEARSYGPADVAGELSRWPLADNVGYLSRLAQTWGVPPFASGRVANASQWSLAARAYAELAREWPEFAKNIAPGRFEALRQAGLSIEASLSSITHTHDADGHIIPNRALFDAALENYQSASSRLKSALGNVAQRWLDEHGRKLDVFGGHDQHVAFADLQPDPGTGAAPFPSPRFECGPSLSMLSEQGLRDVLPASALVAKRLGQGEPRACLRGVHWTNQRLWATPRTQTIYAHLQFQVVAQFRPTGGDWQDLRVYTYTESSESVQCTGPIRGEMTCTDAADAMDGNWDQSDRVAFEAADAPPTSSENARIAQLDHGVDDALVGLQTGYYGTLADSFGSGDVEHAARVLDGAREALAQLVSLGMPQALGADELLVSLLYGGQRLPDGTLVHEFYLGLANGTAAPDWSYINPWPGPGPASHNDEGRVFSVTADRVAALRDILERVFSSQADGTLPSQEQPLLHDALSTVGSTELVISSADHKGAPTVMTAPRISGQARVGATLGTRLGTWAGRQPIRLALKWLRCDRRGVHCHGVAGGKSRTVTSADRGHRLRITVAATNSVGQASATSAATATATQAPVMLAAPRIRGHTIVGAQLNATPGQWTSDAKTTYSWLRCDAMGRQCHSIPNATNQSYRPTGDDQGHRLRIHVTASNTDGHAAANSAATKRVRSASGGSSKATQRQRLPGHKRDDASYTSTSTIVATSPNAESFSPPRALEQSTALREKQNSRVESALGTGATPLPVVLQLLRRAGTDSPPRTTVVSTEPTDVDERACSSPMTLREADAPAGRLVHLGFQATSYSTPPDVGYRCADRSMCRLR